MSLTKLLFPPPPDRTVHLWWIFFALPVRNDQLPAELKFRENTDEAIPPPPPPRRFFCLALNALP